MSDREESYARRAHNISIDDKGLDELQSSLTLHESNGGVTTHQDTVSITCPACEKLFDDLVVCENDYNSLELNIMLDLYAARHDGDVLLLTHEREE